MRRRRRRGPTLVGRLLTLLLALPALYLIAALAGSLIPVNRGWTEPKQGTTVYLVDNGIHTDLIMSLVGISGRQSRPCAATGRIRSEWIPLLAR